VSIALLTSARTLFGLTGRVDLHTLPGIDGPARLPFFSRDLLDHFDFQITLGQQLL
jgi:hypothetical protein